MKFELTNLNSQRIIITFKDKFELHYTICNEQNTNILIDIIIIYYIIYTLIDIIIMLLRYVNIKFTYEKVLHMHFSIRSS